MACGGVHFVLQCYTETWRENNPSLSVWSFPLQNRALCCGGSDQMPRWMDAVFIGSSTKWGQESLQGRAGDLSSKLIDLHSSTLRSWKRQVLSFLGQTYLFTWLFSPIEDSFCLVKSLAYRGPVSPWPQHVRRPSSSVATRSWTSGGVRWNRYPLFTFVSLH